MSIADSRHNPYQTVANTMELGGVPWRCPWQGEVGIPRNFHTGMTL